MNSLLLHHFDTQHCFISYLEIKFIAGSRAMLQAGASYAGITYLLDAFVGGGGSGKTMKNGEYVDSEFGFTDAPVEEDL